MNRRLLMLTLAVLVFLPSTARSEGFWAASGSHTKDYFCDRGNDLMDLFWLQGGAASTYKTAGAHLRLTKFLQCGYLRFEGRKAGVEGRALVVLREKKVQRGAFFFCSDTEVVQEPIHILNAKNSKRPVIRNGWFRGDDGREQPWSIGAEIALPPSSIDLDIGFCPEQVLDLVVGIVGLDPLGDDDVPSGNDPNAWFNEEKK